MPAHGTYKRFGFWSVATPTGAQMLPACGMAWGMQLDGRTDFVSTSIGDAATRQGDFYEAVCFALERSLPVLFIVEDNGYGISHADPPDQSAGHRRAAGRKLARRGRGVRRGDAPGLRGRHRDAARRPRAGLFVGPFRAAFQPHELGRPEAVSQRRRDGAPG